MDNVDVPALVIDSLNEIISEMDKEDQPQMRNLDESTRLIGRKAVLDSLGLVSVIVDVEQKLEEDYGIGITIAHMMNPIGIRLPHMIGQNLEASR